MNTVLYIGSQVIRHARYYRRKISALYSQNVKTMHAYVSSDLIHFGMNNEICLKSTDKTNGTHSIDLFLSLVPERSYQDLTLHLDVTCHIHRK